MDPWSGELRDGCVWGRGALDMKSQVAAEAAAALTLAEEGWRPQSGELLLVFTADEETGAAHGARWLCEQHPDRVACDMVVNEGAGEVFEFDGRRHYGVCAGEKGVFRFTLTTSGTAGHASIPRIGDNALVKLAPILEALQRRPSGVRALAGAGGLHARARPRHRGPRLLDALARGARPARGGAARADARRDLHADDGLGLGEDQRDPVAGAAAGGLPRAARARRARTPSSGSTPCWATSGFEIDFEDTVVGNRSPIDTPLMEHIQAFIEREDPGATAVPVVLPGFSDSRWFRAAFPDCTAYGFFPQRKMDLFEAVPLVHGADERIPVEDLGLAAGFYAGLAEEVLG